MSRPAALAVLLLCAPALARETAVEIPKNNPIVPIATPNFALSLDHLGLSVTPATHLPMPADAVGLAPSQSAIPVQAVSVMPAVLHPMLAADNGGPSADEPIEDGFSRAQAFFDGRAAKLGALPLAAAGTQEQKDFRTALDEAKSSNWKTEKTDLAVFAAEKLFKKLGVKTERIHDDERGPGLRVVAEKGRSEANDLAADAFARLGTHSDYVPGATKGASAMYDGKANRIFLAAPDKPDFYLAYLHEIRHAWYASLLRKGILRLFHLQFVARPGLAVAPGAEAYAGYVSLEELSNYPKTLKHLIVELKRSKGDIREKLADLAQTRVWHMIELLKTGAYLAEVIDRVDRNVGLRPERFSDAKRAETSLIPSEFADHFQLETPRGWYLIPSPRREGKNFWGKRTFKGSEREASDRLRLAAKLIGEMNLDLAPWVIQYKEAVSAEDWDKASRAADKMIFRVAQAEKDWDARQPKK